MYDNVCKFLVETYSQDFAQWLLGEAIGLTQLSPSDLLVEPMRADALILLTAEELVLHLEFQTRPQPNLPYRMAEYRLRGYRRFPDKPMRQNVTAATAVLAGLVLEKAIIQQILREEIVRESVIDQDILTQGLQREIGLVQR